MYFGEFCESFVQYVSGIIQKYVDEVYEEVFVDFVGNMVSMRFLKKLWKYGQYYVFVFIF